MSRKNNNKQESTKMTPSRSGVNAQKGQLRSMPKLPSIPQQPQKEIVYVTEKGRTPNKKRQEPRKQKQKGWWDLTGDILYNLGSKALTHGLTALTGFGDYEVETNSLLAAATEGKNGNGVPLMRNSKVANIVRHREFIGDVYGSTLPFSLLEYKINPGTDTTFPWLSPIARCYTNYRMRGAMFEFVSLATDYSAVPYIGYVAMATQYNSLNVSFTDKKELENSEYANSCKPSESMSHPIECASDQLAQAELYIRQNSSKGDARLYDLGRFSIAVGGQASTTIIGELWITYEVELFFPKLASTSGLMNTYSSPFSDFTNALPLTGGAQKVDGSTMNIIMADQRSLQLEEAAIGQKFMVDLAWEGTSAVCSAGTLLADNCTLSNITYSPQNGIASTQMSITFIMYLDKGVRGGFGWSVLPTLPIYSTVLPATRMIITQIPTVLAY